MLAVRLLCNHSREVYSDIAAYVHLFRLGFPTAISTNRHRFPEIKEITFSRRILTIESQWKSPRLNAQSIQGIHRILLIHRADEIAESPSDGEC